MLLGLTMRNTSVDLFSMTAMTLAQGAVAVRDRVVSIHLRYCWSVGAARGAFGLLASAGAAPEEVRISGDDCAPAVHLAAKDALLSNVLERLSHELNFQLTFGSDTDPLVGVDATGPAIDLILSLAQNKNVSVVLARNPRCPRRERIIAVWVLPNGAQRDPSTPLTRPVIDPQAHTSRPANSMIPDGQGRLVPRSAHE
jgi:hypothetical protein